MKRIIIGTIAIAFVIGFVGILHACPGEAKAKASQASMNSSKGSCAAKAETASSESASNKAEIKTAEAVKVDATACPVSPTCPYSGIDCSKKEAVSGKTTTDKVMTPGNQKVIKVEKSKMAEKSTSNVDLVTVKAGE